MKRNKTPALCALLAVCTVLSPLSALAEDASEAAETELNQLFAEEAAEAPEAAETELDQLFAEEAAEAPEAEPAPSYTETPAESAAFEEHTGEDAEIQSPPEVQALPEDLAQDVQDAKAAPIEVLSEEVQAPSEEAEAPVPWEAPAEQAALTEAPPQLQDETGSGSEESGEAGENAAPAVSKVKINGWSRIEVPLANKWNVTTAYMKKLVPLLPNSVTVSFSDGRPSVTLPVVGQWTPVPSGQNAPCWVNAVDPAGLPEDITDPAGLLENLRIACEPSGSDAYTGTFRLNPATPSLGSTGRFQLLRKLPLQEDAAQLWQLRPAGEGYSAALRMDKSGSGFSTYSVSGNEWYQFEIKNWSRAEGGEWYVLYGRLSSDTAYLTKAISVTVSGTAVTFLPNGGVGTMAVQDFAKGEEKALSANVYTRTGYDFAGWNTKADGSGTGYADGARLRPEADVNLYAQWTLHPGVQGLRLAEGVASAACAAPAGAAVVCAAYDGAGRLLEAQLESVESEGSADYSFSLPAGTVRAGMFVMDGSGAPLCPMERT